MVFADTSFFVALIGRRDKYHELAKHLSQTLRAEQHVSEFVLLELGSACSRGNQRGQFLILVEQFREDPTVKIAPASELLFDKALTLFETRPDKEWSLTDCSSFVLMHEYGIEEALTSDRHFKQAGFTILLK
jgi:predicted nucleic acid-binding protein